MRLLLRIVISSLLLAAVISGLPATASAAQTNFSCAVQPNAIGVKVTWTFVPGATEYAYKLSTPESGNRYGRASGTTVLLPAKSGVPVTVGLAPRFADGRSVPRVGCGTVIAGGQPTPVDPPPQGDGFSCTVSSESGGVRVSTRNVDGVAELSYKLQQDGRGNRYGRLPANGGFITLPDTSTVILGVARITNAGRTIPRVLCGSGAGVPDPPAEPPVSPPIDPPAPTPPSTSVGSSYAETFVCHSQVRENGFFETEWTAFGDLEAFQWRVTDDGRITSEGSTDAGTNGSHSLIAASSQTAVLEISLVPPIGPASDYLPCPRAPIFDHREFQSFRNGTHCFLDGDLVTIRHAQIDNFTPAFGTPIEYHVRWTITGPRQSLSGRSSISLDSLTNAFGYVSDTRAFRLLSGNLAPWGSGVRITGYLETSFDGEVVDSDACGSSYFSGYPEDCRVQGDDIVIDRSFYGGAAISTTYFLVFPSGLVQPYTRGGLGTFSRSGLESSEIGVFMRQEFRNSVRGRNIKTRTVNCRVEGNPSINTERPTLADLR